MCSLLLRAGCKPESHGSSQIHIALHIYTLSSYITRTHFINLDSYLGCCGDPGPLEGSRMDGLQRSCRRIPNDHRPSPGLLLRQRARQCAPVRLNPCLVREVPSRGITRVREVYRSDGAELGGIAAPPWYQMFHDARWAMPPWCNARSSFCRHAAPRSVRPCRVSICKRV